MADRAKHRLLRLALATPAHLGSAWGEAALDRPTQVDAWRGLPFVPASALKGVMAGRLEDVPDEGENQPRERRYGSPDRADKPGQPSSVVLGDGRLLTFPVLGREGSRWWVFPAETLGWAWRFPAGAAGAGGAAPAGLPGFGSLVGMEGTTQEKPNAVSDGPLPSIRGVALESLVNVSPSELAKLAAFARGLAGGQVAPTDRVLVTGAATAAALWRATAEHRHLTALDPGTKTVRAGHLRSVELIPEGAVFLSLVTLLDGQTPDLGLLQVGAWESQGFGWGELSWVDGGGEDDPAEEIARDATSDRSGPRTPDLMDDALDAVTKLSGGDPEVASRARSALRKLGWRLQQQGAQAALAFEAAKARPFDSKDSPEMLAHRWVLDAVMAPGTQLTDWLKVAFAEPLADADLDRAIERLGWLRRYTEVLIAPAEPAETEEVAT